MHFRYFCDLCKIALQANQMHIIFYLTYRPKMGNSNTNPVEYQTKDGYSISYVFWDLKGKNRFPEQPDDNSVNAMLERCLSEIDASADQIKTIREFNTKYKYRFYILHKRKLAEAKKQRELENLKRASYQVQLVENSKDNEEKVKKKELEELMKDVELNETMIKFSLMKIDKYIAEKYAHAEFIAIEGLERFLDLLDKAIVLNSEGTKTSFSNQIQLLKFFKFFSDRYPKEFYSYVPKLKGYARTVLRTYHPVNTHMTAYCLSLLTGYLWRIEEGDNMLSILEKYRLEEKYESFLSPITESIEETDSILMVYYNVKFINELLASVIDEDKKDLLRESLNHVKYGFILENIKAKLEEQFFSLENATFISMHQKIFKYATKGRSEKKVAVEESRVSHRNTTDLSTLHKQILLDFLEVENDREDNDDDVVPEDLIVAYLGESDRKQFNKFILDTLTEIQKYGKLETCLDGSNVPDESSPEDTQQMVNSKINSQNLESHIARIKQSCTKNNTMEFMYACFKNLQYFEKAQWRHLDRFILEELGLEKKMADEVQDLKKSLEEKDQMIKRVIKENLDLKNQLADLRNNPNYSKANPNVGKIKEDSQDFLSAKEPSATGFKKKKKEDTPALSIDLAKKLPVPPSKTKKSELPQMPASLSKFLPTTKASQLPPPPNMKSKPNSPKPEPTSDLQGESGPQSEISSLKIKHEKPMRDKPRLTLTKSTLLVCIEATPVPKSHQTMIGVSANSTTELSASQNPTKAGSQLLPPPSLNSNNSGASSSNAGILPPPPSLNCAILTPPPVSNAANSHILPPPPALNSGTLPPPPPSQNNPILPPPPTLTSGSLPPPPSSSSSSPILPPPPSLTGPAILPPPPGLNSGNLPPPPSTSSILPPPPSMSGSSLPPPPSSSGLPSIPGLPGLPGVPSLGIGNPSNAPEVKKKPPRKPKVPLKACNYTVLAHQKIVDTIFQKIDDTKIEFNEDELIELFAKNTNQNSSKASNSEMKTKSAVVSPVQEKIEVVKILGPQRWRNVEIVLTKLKVPKGEIKRTVIECTGKYTSLSSLESIYKMLPSEEEEQMIKMYEGPEDHLGKPERFFRELLEVSQYNHRIKSMIFSNIKEEFYYELSCKIQDLQKGFKMLMEDKRLHYILEVCLALGNTLNGTTLKGGAWGFKIETIERLEEVKSSDNKMNAAFYLVREVWQKYPYPIFEKEEIDCYQYLSKMPLSQVNQEIGELRNYHKSVERALNSRDPSDERDMIGNFCEEMMMELDLKLDKYKEESDSLKGLYEDCAKLYCDDGKRTGSDQFGKKMFQCILFVSNTEKIFKVIEDRRLKEESRKATKNEMTYSHQQNADKSPASTTSGKSSPTKVNDEDYFSQKPKEEIPPKVKMPGMGSLPKPPQSKVSKEDKLKEFEKMQQEREKKALEEVMMRRTSKLQAVRMSKMSTSNTGKNELDSISFLNGIK